MGPGERWVAFSLEFDEETLSLKFWACLYFITALFLFYIARIRIYPNLFAPRSSFVRRATECALISAVIINFMFIIANIRNNKLETALCYDFISNIFYATLQLSDNYMFFNRLKAIKKIPKWQEFAMHFYICFVLTLTWLPVFTVLPFFVDTNSTMFQGVYNYLLLVEGWGALAYNFYFTLECAIIIFHLNKNCPTGEQLSEQLKRVNAIAFRSIIHCMTSSLGNLLTTYLGDIGDLAYLTIIPLGMHLLFNVKNRQSSYGSYYTFSLHARRPNFVRVTVKSKVNPSGPKD